MRMLLCLLCLLSTSHVHAQAAILSGHDTVSPVEGQNGMVVTGEPLAAQVGLNILKNGKPFLITGSPGGSRIITTTLQIILNVIDHNMNIQEAVNATRIHHQWLPDELRVEEGLSSDTVRLLQNMGHTLSVQATMGAAESIFIDPTTGIYYGAADPRREGLAVGY
ncbi:MAG: gamma-glutamyltranspeptidase/glutathione hydrolase [Candidatus Latescibacterota bacterium]|jgi:gamma-glutamyltranspeptidase/glutathione hydrolase